MTMIFFHWVDASMLGDNQIRKKELKEQGLMSGYVCGFLIEERKDCYVVGMDYFHEEEAYRAVHFYPKSGIDKKSLIVKDIVPSEDKTK